MDTREQQSRRIVYGQSVVAAIYNEGIMMCSDTLLCYGGSRKFRNVSRLFPIRQSKTVLGFSGEYSDIQNIITLIEAMEAEDFVDEVGTTPHSADEYYEYLTRVLYNKRSKMDPYWVAIVVGGFKHDNTPFLGYVDLHGTSYTDSIIATGFGGYMAIALLRDRGSTDMSEANSRTLLEDCMKVLYARNCYGYNKIQMATVTRDRLIVDEPYTINPQWSIKAFFEKDCEVQTEAPVAS